MKSIFFIYLLFLFPIYSLELILKSDEGFICDYIFEDDNYIKIKFKEVLYEIPKKEIEFRSDTKTGAHKGYKLTKVKLSDGSIIKGLLAEENAETITIQTRFGFLKLDKTSIKNTERAEQKEYFPDQDFLEKSYRINKSIIGVSGSALGSNSTNPNTNASIFGASLFIEPSFLNVNSRWNFGVKADHLVKNGTDWLEISNLTTYVQRKIKFSERLDFYWNFGLGGSYIRFHSGSKLLSEGLNPIVTSELGWQGFKLGHFVFRIGLKKILIPENQSIGGVGLELGVCFSL